MNKYFHFLLYILISILIIITQTAVTSPKLLGLFSPDLNLILIIYIALNPRIRGGFILVVINGLLMDFFSGNTTGLYTFTRIIVYIVLRNSVTKFKFKELVPQAIAIFITTFFFWSLIFIILEIKAVQNFRISLNLVIHQATINTLVGIFIVLILRNFDARFQK